MYITFHNLVNSKKSAEYRVVIESFRHTGLTNTAAQTVLCAMPKEATDIDTMTPKGSQKSRTECLVWSLERQAPHGEAGGVQRPRRKDGKAEGQPGQCGDGRRTPTEHLPRDPPPPRAPQHSWALPPHFPLPEATGIRSASGQSPRPLSRRKQMIHFESEEGWKDNKDNCSLSHKRGLRSPCQSGSFCFVEQAQSIGMWPPQGHRKPPNQAVPLYGLLASYSNLLD